MTSKKPPFPLLYILIWKQILSTSDGRDKVFKIIQYLAKMQLWIFNSSDLISKNLSTHCSLFRKMIRLAHVLEPISESFELSELKNNESDLDVYLNRMNVYVSILNDLSDDVICVGKMGILSSNWIRKATPISDRCWFFSIFIDLYFQIQSLKQMKNQKDSKEINKIHLIYISVGKLISDLIFCSIDVFQMGDLINPGWQTVSGLTAASLGTLKLYIKHSKNF